ncbi:glycoside hydrolase family 38 C-terminal domain-containing protein [Actinopolymorpha sp. B9G3]|uniref:alpha-mannosidase n=1 Tax=Actinopolymorpha sp. B9G3 TaxID=3158970 RepID=UPI0032D94E0C
MTVKDALTRLRTAADTAGSGWSPAVWRVPEEDGEVRDIERLGQLDLRDGEIRIARCSLDLPATLHGVDLLGDTLEMTVTSIYPIEVTAGGTVLVKESVPPVATGPALVDVVPAIREGGNGELEVAITALEGQAGAFVTWLGLSFTTPRLRARRDTLDLAWARLHLADELAATAEERRAVEASAALVPVELLDTEETDLATALDAMATALVPVAERVAAIDVHVIGHCHIDLAWLWSWDDAREVIKRDIRSVLAIMRDYPEVTFTHSQPAGYEVVRTEEPELFAQIVSYVRQGRWEPATTQWVEGDTNLASGEAMASQLLEGVTFTREHLGVSPKVFLAPDTFGHSANLPQLAVDAGAQVYYHHRCNPGAESGRRWPAYWWEGVDGTRILACSTDSYNGNLSAGAIARATAEAAAAGLPAALLFVGVGDHGGGPTRQGYDILRSLTGTFGLPTARCSTLQAYARQLVSAGVQLPVHRGESSTIFEGCYTSHVDAKQTNRDGENRLATAEALTALAGIPRDPALTQGWRDVCFHQFHDILDGSAIAEAYVKTREDHARIVRETDAVIDRALAVLADAAQEGAVVVANPLGHDREDLVIVPGVAGDVVRPVLVDPGGRRTPGQHTDDGLAFVARVPAYGTTTYRVTEATGDQSPQPELWDGPDPALAVRQEGGSEEDPRYLRIETPHFRVALRRDCGILTSFVDKRTGRDLVAFGMQRMSDYGDTARPDLALNVFQVVDERPHFMSSWQYQEVETERSLLAGATSEVLEEGPVRVVVGVTHEFRSSRIVERLSFYRDLPRVDFAVDVDWQEPGDEDHGVPNLKLAFTPDVDECEAWFEAPYAAVRRRSNGQQVPALRWADVGGAAYGVAVLNDSTYGHDVLGSRVRLTLVRTSYVPDPRSDRGRYAYRFAFVPHLRSWREAGIPHLAAGFNQPLVARVASVHTPDTAETTLPGWRLRVEPAVGVSSVVRLARTGVGTVVRIAETSGRAVRTTVSGLPAGAQVRESDLTETRGRPIGSGGTAVVDLRPWQVRTLLVDAGRLEH